MFKLITNFINYYIMGASLIHLRKTVLCICLFTGVMSSFAQYCKWDVDKIDEYEACIKELRTAYDSMTDENSKHADTKKTRKQMYQELMVCYKQVIEHFGYEDLRKEKKYKEDQSTLEASKLVSKKTPTKSKNLEKKVVKKKDTSNSRNMKKSNLNKF